MVGGAVGGPVGAVVGGVGGAAIGNSMTTIIDIMTVRTGITTATARVRAIGGKPLLSDAPSLSNVKLAREPLDASRAFVVQARVGLRPT